MSSEFYMHRCLQLARLAAGNVAPNPLVGAVLVHNDKIIGEGFHQYYGGPHAEVNCIEDAKKRLAASNEPELLQHATLFVSLEPCAHFGKTPPCADLIIKEKIPRVVIGCKDPFAEVNGRGIMKLKQAGVEVITEVLENESRKLNERFFTFQTQHRPYIILKWAQTADGKIAGTRGQQRLIISNEQTNRLVHKWRSQEASVLVGTHTALLDDPLLTVRNWEGKNPLRLVIDPQLQLPPQAKMFDRAAPAVVFNTFKHTLGEEAKGFLLDRDSVHYYQLTHDAHIVHQVLNALYRLQIQSVLVEGGARLLQSFIDEGSWDEIRVITNESLKIGNGLAAPGLPDVILEKEDKILTDTIRYYRPQLSTSTST